MKRKYKVVACHRCGNAQITTANTSFTCFRCGANNRISRESILYLANSHEEAREELIRIKARKRS
ncbi:MAG: DUF1922 domain-containing protein [Aigarchaeota archaeon]|nr:DUF1922 domain-containing protein [Candidatus Pelearchaeum maunauluense]